MSDFARLVVLALAAANPFAAVLLARRLGLGDQRQTLLRGAAIAAGAATLVVLAADGFLSALDLSPETFRTSAGIVLIATGSLAVLRPAAGYASLEGGWRDAVFPAAIPLLLGPGLVTTAIVGSADEGIPRAWVAVAAAIVATSALVLALKRAPTVAIDPLARLTGVLAIALGVGLIVSGVRDV